MRKEVYIMVLYLLLFACKSENNSLEKTKEFFITGYNDMGGNIYINSKHEGSYLQISDQNNKSIYYGKIKADGASYKFFPNKQQNYYLSKKYSNDRLNSLYLYSLTKSGNFIPFQLKLENKIHLISSLPRQFAVKEKIINVLLFTKHQNSDIIDTLNLDVTNTSIHIDNTIYCDSIVISISGDKIKIMEKGKATEYNYRVNPNKKKIN